MIKLEHFIVDTVEFGRFHLEARSVNAATERAKRRTMNMELKKDCVNLFCIQPTYSIVMS
jgi:hypothetical protein